jgi:hypothetical protein
MELITCESRDSDLEPKGENVKIAVIAKKVESAPNETKTMPTTILTISDFMGDFKLSLHRYFEVLGRQHPNSRR